jgi:DNA-directed RNA polymerase subunit beta
VFFDHDKGKTHSSGKLLSPPASSPIAAPGSTSSSTPRTSSRAASTASARSRHLAPYALGLDGEEILETFYNRIAYARRGTAGACPSTPSA